MSRATKQQVEARTADILRIILDGAEGWDLCEYVREKQNEAESCWFVAEGETPLSYSQIRRYAQRAEEMIRESCRTSRKKLFRRHLAQRRNLFAKAVSQGDIRAALACVRDEAEMQGLYPDKNLKIGTKDGGPLVLKIVEEIHGRPTADLANIHEEVVSNGSDSNTTGAGNKNDPPASSPA